MLIKKGVFIFVYVSHCKKNGLSLDSLFRTNVQQWKYNHSTCILPHHINMYNWVTRDIYTLAQFMIYHIVRTKVMIKCGSLIILQIHKQHTASLIA